LRRGANSYAIRSIGAEISPAESLGWVLVRVGRVPNHAWLALILLTCAALSVSTMMAARDRERQAEADRGYTEQRVLAARKMNANIRRQTVRLQTDARLAEQVAQERLRLVRSDEVVVAIGKSTDSIPQNELSSSVIAQRE
jgi:hypothetical protein